MQRADILILSFFLITAGCGIKGAPMPRRDEVFIEKTMLKPASSTEKRDKEDNTRDKTTILPKKDPR